jgi:hypothetical protein
MSDNKYGKVNPRFSKYFAHLPTFDTNDRVRVINGGPFDGDEGRVIIRNKVAGQYVYGVDFETGGKEVYFQQRELERTDS